MITNNAIQQSLYLSFAREKWSHLRNAVPLTLNEAELQCLKGINEKISLAEVTDIYLPLSRLLNLIVGSKQQRGLVLSEFLKQRPTEGPYIISIAGSVAVGKSTTARIMQTLLQRWPEHPKVDLVTTDGFLYPLATLKKKNVLHRKGFPESYDTKMLLDVISALKSGQENVSVPLYSHITYDRCQDVQTIRQPDILILEGLNVLQSGNDSLSENKKPFVSDFVDFSIYVDANETLLKQWYIDRFLKFRSGAFSNKDSYFHHFAKLTDSQAKQTASEIWDSINRPNLVQNILPTKDRANLILQKSHEHLISHVHLRK